MLILAGAAASLFGKLLDGVGPVFLAKGRAQLADQTFLRKMADYKLTIEQQKLFREDIRDLVELSVARMDIYHLVGALLLGVCITLYTKNPTLDLKEEEGKDAAPAWVVSLFLVSNLGATGYLTLATWFSMHASVASHTIGVRLLTRFARLSIPSRKDLEEMARAPLIPLPLQARQQDSILVEASLDKEHHLRRFLREQKHWLSYDAHARICMSLGMNQLLLALSYFIIARASGHHPVGSLLSLCGLSVLGVVLQRLDVLPGVHIKIEAASVVLLGEISPIVVAIIAWLLHLKTGGRILTSSLSLAFALHGMWLLYNGVRFQLFSAEDLSMLPVRLRAVLYLDVLRIEPNSEENPGDFADDFDRSTSPSTSAPSRRQTSRRTTLFSGSTCLSPALLPRRATPPEELPRVLARRFTFAMLLLWLVACGLHLSAALLSDSTLRAQEASVLEPPVLSAEDVADAPELHEVARIGLLDERIVDSEDVPSPGGLTWIHPVKSLPQLELGSFAAADTEAQWWRLHRTTGVSSQPC